jgi:hypothetical protein
VAEIRSAFAVDDLYGPMIVAMVAMLVMQPSIDEIIHMVAMRDRLMSAARAMDMPRFVPFMSVLRRAAGRVVGGYFNYMLLDIVACLMVQMSIMQIVDVIAMLHPKVTAMSAMMMRMRRRRAGGHESSPFVRPKRGANAPWNASSANRKIIAEENLRAPKRALELI